MSHQHTQPQADHQDHLDQLQQLRADDDGMRPRADQDREAQPQAAISQAYEPIAWNDWPALGRRLRQARMAEAYGQEAQRNR